MRRTTVIIAVLVAGLGAATASVAGRGQNRPPAAILRSPESPGTLAGKLEWALGRPTKAGPARSFWVGYSIDRLQGEHSQIGSFHPGGKGRDLSIAEVLAGIAAPAGPRESAGDVRKAATEALEVIEGREKPEKMVMKELGFFLKYDEGSPPALAGVEMSNLDLAFDFEGATLCWLGKAPEDQSLALVKKLYGSARENDVREDLIAAAGCHGTAALVVPFLAGVVAGGEPDDLRKDAAFWMGQQNDAEGLRLLVRTARSDKSEDVREGAVFSISQVELPAAVDELIALARGAERQDVRKQAVFWLGQMASEKAGGALEEFARKDGDFEVQEQAVFALSQLPGNAGVDALVKLARTHPDFRVRKKAVFWLGECDDSRALEALVTILKGK